MVRRILHSDFIGGGLRVSRPAASILADGGADAEAACVGRSDAEASALLGVSSGGLAYWVAVLREILRRGGSPRRIRRRAHRGPTASRCPTMTRPRALSSTAGPSMRGPGLSRRLPARGSPPGRGPGPLLRPLDHPGGRPRRYDTRFFVAGAPPFQTPAHDAAETIAWEWIRPGTALRRHRDGEIELIFPTICNLKAIGASPRARSSSPPPPPPGASR